MRLVFAFLAALILAQCAGADARRFRVGESPEALVMIGVAESYDARQPRYTVLWRRVEDGVFQDVSNAAAFEAVTNGGDTVRVAGVPGEFTVARVQPGLYALDSVFARLREGRVDYIAQGVVEGPDRPAFEVRAGEAIYLGIWQAHLDGAQAAVRLWRLDPRDVRPAARAARAVTGPIEPRQTHTLAVPCEPRRLGAISQRQVC